jgi:hypothetical protein
VPAQANLMLLKRHLECLRGGTWLTSRKPVKPFPAHGFGSLARWRHEAEHPHVGHHVAVVQVRVAEVLDQHSEMAGAMGGAARIERFFKLRHDRRLVRVSLRVRVRPLNLLASGASAPPPS